jgi:hypothetical protein
MKKLSFLVSLLFSCALLSQEPELEILRGRIVFSSMNQSPINILNLTQNTGTTNDEDGDFEISVKLGDELLFSSVQYMPYRIIIDKEILKMEKMIVELVPSVTKLKQVNISNIDLSGNLVVDANSIETEIVYDNQTLGFPPPSPAIPIETRRIYTMSSGFLGAIVGAISGELKRLKRLEEAAELKFLVEKASKSLDAEFFEKECDIPEEYLISFMYFCSEDDYFKRLVNADQKLDLTEYFIRKAMEYREMKGWEE